MNYNFIGVDFSKNSTGITLITPNTKHFFSFVKDYEKNSHKKGFRYHNLLNEEVSDCTVQSYELLNTTNPGNYYEKEWNKMKNGRTIVSVVKEQIEQFISEDNWENTVVAFEGYAYGAKGNILIDIVTMTTLLKDYFESKTGKEVYVFAPTQIKSSATGHGQSKKDGMFDSFKKEKLKHGSEFQNFCIKEKDILIEKKKGIEVAKPFDDIIDSYFVVKHLILELAK